MERSLSGGESALFALAATSGEGGFPEAGDCDSAAKLCPRASPRGLPAMATPTSSPVVAALAFDEQNFGTQMDADKRKLQPFTLKKDV